MKKKILKKKKHVYRALYQQNPYFKPSKTLTNHIQTSYVQISTKTHNGQEIENYIEKKTKPIPFLEDWWGDDEKNGGFVSGNGGFGKGRDGQDYEQSQYARKKWKVFENCPENNPHYAKHVFFTTGMSHKLVTKNPCDKFWKTFVSIFHDWKVHSWVSHEGSHKAFWVKFATKASIWKLVAKLSRKNTKNREILKVF